MIDQQFVLSVRDDLLRFARLQLRDESLAADAVQEALLAALSHQQQFSGKSALKTWVFSILRHKIIDLIRQQQRHLPASQFSQAEESLDQTFETLFKANDHWHPDSRPKDWGNPEQALHQQDFWLVFETCLTHLPENTARVFMMREFLGLETPEICQTLDINTNNCNVILHRARNTLRRCLEHHWFAPGERPCLSC